MGTHPIFESDFDCLTDVSHVMARYYCHDCRDNREINLDDWQCTQCQSGFIEEIRESPLYEVLENNRRSTNGREQRPLYVSPDGDLHNRPRDVENFLRRIFGGESTNFSPDEFAIGPNGIEPLQNIISRLIDAGLGSPPASENFLTRLVEEPFTEELSERSTECAICMCEYTSEDMIIKVPCGHFFHSNCIRSWLELHNTCPVCRNQFTE